MSDELGHSMDSGNKLKWIISIHSNWKKKFQGPFWRYKLNSTANLANSLRKWAQWTELAVLCSWQLQNGSRDFDFFQLSCVLIFIFELISIVHWVPHFFMRYKSILGRVKLNQFLNPSSFPTGIPMQKFACKNSDWRRWKTPMKVSKYLTFFFICVFFPTYLIWICCSRILTIQPEN